MVYFPPWSYKQVMAETDVRGFSEPLEERTEAGGDGASVGDGERGRWIWMMSTIMPKRGFNGTSGTRCLFGHM